MTTTIERICGNCGVPFPFTFHGDGPDPRRGRFCSMACRSENTWRQRRERGEVGRSRYRMIRRRGHPLADKTGRVHEHRVVLFEKIGPGTHPCHWCGVSVTWMPGSRTKHGALTADHIDNNGWNNAPDNLVPSCHGCNARRDHTGNIRDNETVVIKQGRRLRAELRTCRNCESEFPFYVLRARPDRGKVCCRGCWRTKGAAHSPNCTRRVNE